MRHLVHDVVARKHEFGPTLDDGVGLAGDEFLRPDAPSHAITCFEHRDLMTQGYQAISTGEAREAGPDDDDAHTLIMERRLPHPLSIPHFRADDHTVCMWPEPQVGYLGGGLSWSSQRTPARASRRQISNPVTGTNPPRLTASPKTSAMSSRTRILLPAASTHGAAAQNAF